MKTWLKGGLIIGLISAILGLIFPFEAIGGGMYIRLCIISFVFWFIIGFIIGSIMGLIIQKVRK